MERLTLEQLDEVAKHGCLAAILANKNIMGLAAHLAQQTAEVMRENEKLRDMLTLILPMAKGYAAMHRVGSNDIFIEKAENLLSGTEGEKP